MSNVVCLIPQKRAECNEPQVAAAAALSELLYSVHGAIEVLLQHCDAVENAVDASADKRSMKFIKETLLEAMQQAASLRPSQERGRFTKPSGSKKTI